MGLTDYSILDKRHFESGREYEQERIIKLLSKDRNCGHDDCTAKISLYEFIGKELNLDLFKIIREDVVDD